MRSDNWEIGEFDRNTAIAFCRDGINPLVSVFLASRKVNDIGEARSIIGYDPREFHDPFLMADMDKAVKRIKKAIKNKERIAIYGDYDVDGMTSVTVFAIWLKKEKAEFEIYIPGRFDEGYGLNKTALDMLKSHGTDLVITVDCGITAIEEALHAEAIGLDLIITDHHECRDILPKACAVVDPKRSDCNYPYKSLAGVGVAFKLICALEGDYLSDDIFNIYGESVATGTVADVMPVIGENRDLIRRGLHMMNLKPGPGMRSLLREVNIAPGNITASTISFMIAPRLNAAGRMGKTELSVELLLTEDIKKAEMLSEELCRLNNERRELEQKIYEDAAAMMHDPEPNEPIILARHGWYQGVTGIVAAKMAERYKLPAIIISIDEDGMGRGSCRSYGSFAIYDALCTCEDLLDNYGGHEMAAGVTIPENNIAEFQKRLNEYYHNNITGTTGSGLKIDFEVEKPELLNIPNIEALEQLEPFGNGNPPPCLCIKEAVVTSLQSIGTGKHSKLKIEKSGKIIDCIFFSVPVEDLNIKEGNHVDIAFEPQVNEFKGRSSVQLQLSDIKMSNS